MNRALIDTDILSYYFKGDPTCSRKFQKVSDRIRHHRVSLITYYEIMSGLLHKNAHKQLEILNADFIGSTSNLALNVLIRKSFE